MRPAAAPLHADLPELLACGVTGRLQGPSGVRRSGVNSACRDFRKHGEGRQVVEREVGAKQDEPPKTESAPAEPADQEANKRFSLRRLARADSEFPSASAELLASVAHEVNQPLYAIGNYAKACVQVLQGDNPDVGTARQWLEKIAASAFRGHDILRRFRELASYQEPERTNVSILELIDNALEMLEFELSSARVEVQKTLVAPQLTIYADRTLIRQALVNLCKNACEALHANPPIGR
jgi:C4-dicarboxylate-specific signal transduction histidine kinase